MFSEDWSLFQKTMDCAGSNFQSSIFFYSGQLTLSFFQALNYLNSNVPEICLTKKDPCLAVLPLESSFQGVLDHEWEVFQGPLCTEMLLNSSFFPPCFLFPCLVVFWFLQFVLPFLLVSMATSVSFMSVESLSFNV
jgi:hypothetical protein